MLNILRKKRNSLIVKILLGTIIVSFAAFFGVTSMQKGGAAKDTIATVNGEPINPARFQYYYDSQIEQLQKAFNNQVPPEYLSGLYSSIANTLINQKLLFQELQKYGFKVSKDELADVIMNSTQFQRNGKFDPYYYENRFLPGYALQTGESYEQDLMRELLQEKIFGEFEELVQPNPAEIELWHKIDNTKYKFSVIKIFTKTLEDTDSGAGNNKDPAQLTPEQKAKNLYAAWKAGKDIKAMLEEYRLTIEEIPEINATKIKNVFGGKGDLENLKKLIALTPQRPFTDTYIEEGNYYYLIKLSGYNQPEKKLADDKELQQQLNENYTKNVVSDLQSAFIRSLRKNAKITINDQIK